jgi:hypothetical protein
MAKSSSSPRGQREGKAAGSSAPSGSPPKRDRTDTQLTIILPAYVVEQVRAAARGEPGSTLRLAVLRALAKAGYDIDESDMVDRRAEAARIRSELYRQYKERR